MWDGMWDVLRMKPKGRHQHNRLTDLTVRQKKATGRYADGNGLQLLVEPSGAKRWVQRLTIQGHRRDLGLGGFPAVSLRQAREAAAANLTAAREGRDPLAERRKATRAVPTFEMLAKHVHDARKGKWKQGGKHIDQWINTLATYAFPIIGKLPADQVTSAEILRILEPIWHTKKETAKRVRQRIDAVFCYAKSAGYCAGNNPARDLDEALGQQMHVVQHHEAMPYDRVPGFVQWLRTSASTEVVRLSFEFLVLTVTRSDDVRSALKVEVNFAERTWTIPSNRGKTGWRTGKAHVVPLCNRAIEILRRAWSLDPDSLYIFPAMGTNETISENTFGAVLERIGSSAKPHGFRSSFKDWASEETRHEHFVVEKALSHVVPDKVEAAYRRGQLLKKRGALMDDWVHFIETGQSQTTLVAPGPQAEQSSAGSAQAAPAGVSDTSLSTPVLPAVASIIGEAA
jgi:integrase